LLPSGLVQYDLTPRFNLDYPPGPEWDGWLVPQGNRGITMNPGTPTTADLRPVGKGEVPRSARASPSSAVPQLRAPTPAGCEAILSPAAIDFLAVLERQFGARRKQLLRQRDRFRRTLLQGLAPELGAGSEGVRDAAWTVAPPPEELRDRRVEITGPPDRKMIVRALNSGASVFMADFEDAHSPTWRGTIQGQQNLVDAVHHTLEVETPEGEVLRPNEKTAVLMMRPRGWHLTEEHLFVDRLPMSAALFDAGLFLFHNAVELHRRGSDAYLYLPKLEHASEARLWNDVLLEVERMLGLPSNAIRTTVLIETLPAVFEMDEILYELRDRSLGLNCGRWDYIFSFIKQFRDDRQFVLPDRASLTMDAPFLAAYSRLLVQTCHRRRAHAMGGMAAQIPIKDDPTANESALAKVREDKEREVMAGHDGTWVAHPGLVPVAREVFDRLMTGPNQIDLIPAGGEPTPEELLDVPRGAVTVDGVRRNVRAPLRYLDAWFRGTGAVAIDHLMEDTATVEISRAQLWQWIHHKVKLADGRVMGLPAFRALLAEERDRILKEAGTDAERRRSVQLAERLFNEIVSDEAFADFVTIPACAVLRGLEAGRPNGGSAP
jgi:malate synthase